MGFVQQIPQIPRLEELVMGYAARRAELDAHGIYFLRDVDDQQAENFSKSLIVMAAQRAGRPDQAITLYVNSGGGAVGAGLAMIEMIFRVRRVYNVAINCVVTGYAYSMGAIIVQAGDRRSMGKFSTMMLHSGMWFLTGDAEKIFHDYHKLEKHYEQIVGDLFAQRTGQHDTNWWRDFIYSGHDRFLTAQECLDLGLVDEVVN